MSLPQERSYTTEYIYSLSEGQRAELIDGQIYNMAPPNFLHQKLIMELSAAIHQYIKSKKENCEVLPAPFAVFLNQDNQNYVEPDISIICDKNKLDKQGCTGAPDWIIEIASPSTERMDYGIKLFKYRSAGVREYWIVNPLKQTVMVYDFQDNLGTKQYSFDEAIPVCIYQDLTICVSQLIDLGQ